jgi:hypothetical protein
MAPRWVRPLCLQRWVGQAVLSACEHIAQVYAELKQRHGFRAARAILRAELQRFILAA